MKKTIQNIEAYVTQNFSLSEIRTEGDVLIKENSLKELIALAKKLFSSSHYQVRMIATYFLGKTASHSFAVVAFLKETVSNDVDWRVQELLAMAFDTYCRDVGYEKSLPTIKSWLKDKNPYVNRAVTEGLRIWTSREYFKQHPQVAIDLLSSLKDNGSEYVRKSVGNALRDISKKEKELIQKEVKNWDITNKEVKQTYSLASKFL